MEITSINASQFAKMFLAGAKNLEAKKEWINELNVFPVPDGDTGTNMSMTIMSAAKAVSELEQPTMATLAKAISSGSLRGARGNSGVILSQLFRGFCKVIGEVEEIDEELSRQMYERLIDRLTATGFEHYEISNFAKPTRRSRHNSSYWQEKPYIGLGAAAHSFNLYERLWNVADIRQYIDSIENGYLPVESESIDGDTRYNDRITVALRTCE